jgi:D-alanyl-D-alanine carboxypeptidase
VPPTSPALAVARAALAEHPMPAAAPAPAVYETAAAVSVPAAPALKSTNVRGPWLIQVGAFPKEAEAQERLREAKTLAKAILAKADPFTERVTKGSQELYRARFAGLGEKQAEAACRHFKKNEIACMAIKN